MPNTTFPCTEKYRVLKASDEKVKDIFLSQYLYF